MSAGFDDVCRLGAAFRTACERVPGARRRLAFDFALAGGRDSTSSGHGWRRPSNAPSRDWRWRRNPIAPRCCGSTCGTKATPASTPACASTGSVPATAVASSSPAATTGWGRMIAPPATWSPWCGATPLGAASITLPVRAPAADLVRRPRLSASARGPGGVAGRRGILMPGGREAGKSTTVFACANARLRSARRRLHCRRAGARRQLHGLRRLQFTLRRAQHGASVRSGGGARTGGDPRGRSSSSSRRTAAARGVRASRCRRSSCRP